MTRLQEPDPKKTMMEFDYIIIGAGTAGCLLANRLSADPNKRVLLLEAGGKDDYIWIHVPVGYLYCIGNPRADWCFKTEANPGLNGRTLLYPRGKTLGGCSSINGMIYMRGQARDYDAWAAETGDQNWNWENCLRDFKRHEDNFRLDGASGVNADHAGGGEWRVERQRLRWEILESFQDAAVQAGIAATPDFNTGTNEGVGYFEVNQRGGWRWNAAKGFLKPVRHRRNLEIRTGAHVQNLVLEVKADGTLRCTGAVVRRDGMTVTVTAKREVILSAGAIGSPQILQLSGIGDGAFLRKQGVLPQHHLAGVGMNLQDHLQLRSVFRVSNVKTLNEVASTLIGKARIGLEYLLFRSGPMSMAPSQLGIFTKSSADRDHANIQFHVQPLSLPAFGQPLHSFPGITASVCNLNPSSKGSVMIASPRAGDAPKIAPNYLDTQEDQQVAIESLQVARRILNQPALAKYRPAEVLPGADKTSPEQLLDAARAIGSTIFHPVGTTKMGRHDDPMAVVDTHLRVIGMTGLRVVDAGVMPNITSGNTNSPTLMIAEKAAAMILADARE